MLRSTRELTKYIEKKHSFPSRSNSSSISGGEAGVNAAQKQFSEKQCNAQPFPLRLKLLLALFPEEN